MFDSESWSQYQEDWVVQNEKVKRIDFFQHVEYYWSKKLGYEEPVWQHIDQHTTFLNFSTLVFKVISTENNKKDFQEFWKKEDNNAYFKESNLDLAKKEIIRVNEEFSLYINWISVNLGKQDFTIGQNPIDKNDLVKLLRSIKSEVFDTVLRRGASPDEILTTAILAGSLLRLLKGMIDDKENNIGIDLNILQDYINELKLCRNVNVMGLKTFGLLFGASAIILGLTALILTGGGAAPLVALATAKLVLEILGPSLFILDIAVTKLLKNTKQGFFKDNLQEFKEKSTPVLKK